MYGQRAGVRENGVVKYVGWAVPETVYFDYAILEAAPKHINRAGIGDVFCFFTGAWDWEYAHGSASAKPNGPMTPVSPPSRCARRKRRWQANRTSAISRRANSS